MKKGQISIDATLRLDSALKNSYDLLDRGVVILDSQLQILYMNTWVRSKFPKHLHSVSRLAQLSENEESSAMLSLFEDTLAAQEVRIVSPVFPYWLVSLPDHRFDDGFMRQQLRLQPIRVQGETPSVFEGLMIEIEDISNLVLQVHKTRQMMAYQNLLEEQMQRTSKQMEAAKQAKSKFLANMSHEICTPLNVLLPLSQFLAENKSGTLTPKDLECAQAIYGSSVDLSLLINETLDFSQLDSGKFTLHQEKFHLRDLVEQTMCHFTQAAEAKGLLLNLEFEISTPETLVSDAQKIEKVLKNLLSNALKFTSRGKVTLHVYPVEDEERLERDLSSEIMVALAVSDMGIGIPLDKQEPIFQIFEQADGSFSRQYGGVGLGLAVAKKLAEVLQGALFLESKEGQGSTFTLYLPIDLEVKKNIIVDEVSLVSKFRSGLNLKEIHEEKLPVLENKKVLVVDDDMRNVFTLKAIIRQAGGQVLAAKSGKEGIELLEKTPDIDLVLVDLLMPVVDGYSAIRHIRDTGRFPNLPIIALTTKVMPSNRERSLEIGADSHITKPFDNQQLFALLNKYLQ